MIERKTAIQRAKDTLECSPELRELLNRRGFVRVSPQLDTLTTFSADEVSEIKENTIVTFTIEDTPIFGRRVMVEYQGHKEFAA